MRVFADNWNLLHTILMSIAMPGNSGDLRRSSGSAHCRVQLLKSVCIPPRESISVAVKTTSSLHGQDTMMLDSDPNLTPDGVKASPSLLISMEAEAM